MFLEFSREAGAEVENICKEFDMECVDLSEEFGWKSFCDRARLIPSENLRATEIVLDWYRSVDQPTK